MVDPNRKLAVIACVVAVLGLVYPIPGFWELYCVPAGDAGRPMGQAMALFVAGLGTPMVVLPLAIVAMRQRGMSRVLGAVALLLSALPLPLYGFLFRWIVRAHDLTVLP